MGGGASAPKKEEPSFQRTTLVKSNYNSKSSSNNSSSAGVGGHESKRELVIDSHVKPAHTTYHQVINDKSARLRLDKASSREPIAIFGERINFKLDWCYASQRGYYPNAHEKANQDSYVICENICKNNQCHLFGIFDGHGEFGDLCSHFAANQLPAHLEPLLMQNCPKGLDNKTNSHLLHQILTDAFVSTNLALHKSRIDDRLSGTTAVSVYIQNDVLYVANVGDSRAIIASEIDGNITFSPLSTDQTPLRKDERERLKKRGAVIRTLDQIEGIEPIHENWGDDNDAVNETGDPPRVWDSTLERPGCAFTRSIGDAFAEIVGVHAEPELLTWKLCHRDRFIIICSDGVTEFLTSSMICDMMSKSENHLQGACRIIDEAYRLWLTYDDRTDDITIIVLTLNDITPVKGHGEDSEFIGAKIAKINSMSSEDRPVRRVMSKTKRKEIIENWQDDSFVDFDISKFKTPKTAEELEKIQSMTRTNFMFQNLSSSQKDQIFSVMKLKNVKEGDLIIREGDKGDEMYVIDSGEFIVLKKNIDGINQEIFTYTTAGATFGELSLMYGKPRAASIKAKTDGKLWCIGRQAFRTVLMPKKKDGLLRLVKSIHFFQDLTFAQVQCICETSYEEEFLGQDIILKSKTIHNCKWALAVVLSGSVLMIPADGGGKVQSRIKDSYVAAEEIRRNYSELRAGEKSKIAFFSKATILGVIGDIAYENLLESLGRNDESGGSAGKIKKRGMSLFNPSEVNLKESTLNRSDFKVESAMLLIGDYAYVGCFKTARFGTNSGKVIAKERAAINRMDSRLSQEKKVLDSLAASSSNGAIGVARIEDFFQDSKVAIFLYSDVFVCDLGLAISSNAITDVFRPFFASSVVAAVGAVHGLGFMHRFINPGSFYITNTGTLKLVDMRYAKPMDGNMSFTICGDPLYFSPELVNQRGYDYSNDIWAIGATLLEIYEIPLPWGTLNTEETVLFKAILAFKTDSICFNANIHKNTKDLIYGLLNPSRTNRLGFKSYQDIKECPFFSGFLWSSLDTSLNIKVDFESSVDISTLFVDSDLNPASEESNAFFSSV